MANSDERHIGNIPKPEGWPVQRTQKPKADEHWKRTERQSNWKRLLQSIGDRYANATLENFDVYDDDGRQADAIASLREYRDTLAERVEDGEGIILFGPEGTGKDHLLCGLLRHAIAADLSVSYIRGIPLLQRIKDSLMDSRGELSTDQLVREYVKPDVLAISDPVPPFGELGTWEIRLLFQIVDDRYRKCRPTWLTVNVSSGPEAEERISAQVTGRLRHNALTVHCDWPSYRQPKRRGARHASADA